jgi:hypothetical protein
MEDVPEVYPRPCDPQRPIVCLDETSKKMIIETRAPIPVTPGCKARHDYEYERNGVANLFMMFARDRLKLGGAIGSGSLLTWGME